MDFRTANTLRRRKQVESYDFKHPKLFSKEIMRSVRTLHEGLSRDLARVITSSLRQKVDINLVAIKQLVTLDFMQSIETPAAFYMLNAPELNGDIMMVLDPEVCLMLVERLSGGRSSERYKRRSLTTIEEKIMSRIIANINREVIAAWEPYISFTIESVHYESKSENIHNIIDEPAIIAEYSLEVNGEDMNMWIAYPYSLLKETLNAAVHKMGIGSRKEILTPEGMTAYQFTLKHVPVMLRPLLGRANLTFNSLMELKEGDAIALDQKIDKPLVVQVNDVDKIKAFPGVVRNRRAVKIYEIIEDIKEQELL
jgi:flagellar motor switch protein FliM